MEHALKNNNRADTLGRMKTRHDVTGFENLHRHTDYSLLDGLATVREYAIRSNEINQKYLCITDHGVLGAIPQQISESDKHGLYPIFGCELYINRMQFKASCREESAAFRKQLSEPEQKRFDKSCHLLAIAYNATGYKNLVRLSSWGHIHGYYRRPRINWDILQEHKEGLIVTSTCAISEIATAFFTGGDDAGFSKVEEYKAAFGDKFYLEMMMLDFKDQKPYDAFLIRAHNRYNIPMIMTCDCHYCKREHSYNQRLMLMMQNDRTIHEIEALVASGAADDLFELQDQNQWMKSEEELNEKWESSDYSQIIDYDLFKQAKANTVKICELAKGVEMDRSIKLPQFPNDKNKLWELAQIGFKDRGLPDTKEYRDRLKEEYDLICEKEFASYFLIEKMMVDEAFAVAPKLYGFDDPSVARGPGRGSQCGSLLSYCLDLHDLEPIQHGLSFWRFLSPARGGRQMKLPFTQKPVSVEAASESS